MCPESPPPPGVSSLDDTGSRTPVDSGPKPPRPRRHDPRADPLSDAAHARAREVDPRTPPPGTNRSKRDVVEVPIQTQRSRRFLVTWDSVDGHRRQVSKADVQGKLLSRAEQFSLCFILAFRELSLGGDPGTVLKAFGVRVEDIDGALLFPFPKLVHRPEAAFEESLDPAAAPAAFALAEDGE